MSLAGNAIGEPSNETDCRIGSLRGRPVPISVVCVT
jgi:hypothetical protein